MPKKYPPEFKADVARVARRGDLTLAEVAADFVGGVGIRRAREVATGRGLAIAGTILGVVALLLGVLGVVVINDATNELDRQFQEIERQLRELD